MQMPFSFQIVAHFPHGFSPPRWCGFLFDSFHKHCQFEIVVEVTLKGRESQALFGWFWGHFKERHDWLVFIFLPGQTHFSTRSPYLAGPCADSLVVSKIHQTLPTLSICHAMYELARTPGRWQRKAAQHPLRGTRLSCDAQPPCSTHSDWEERRVRGPGTWHSMRWLEEQLCSLAGILKTVHPEP